MLGKRVLKSIALVVWGFEILVAAVIVEFDKERRHVLKASLVGNVDRKMKNCLLKVPDKLGSQLEIRRYG